MRNFKVSCLCLSILALLLCLAVAGNNTRRVNAQGDSAAFADSMNLPAGDSHSFDIANMDRSAPACQNFFQYANGGWTKSNPVPAAYSRWGRFELLEEQNTNVLHGILDGLIAKTKFANSNEQKIADFYGSCMDEQKIEGDGMKPLEPELQRIAQISDLPALEDEIARLHAHRIPAVFGFGASQDAKDSTQIIAQLVQGGLGLPDRDYYTNDDAKSKATREE